MSKLSTWILKLISTGLIARAAVSAAETPTLPDRPEKWGVAEVAIRSNRAYQNPFADADLSCVFSSGDQKITATGFYDGDHTWKCRLMPTLEGQWSVLTRSNDNELNDKRGSFQVLPASRGNHGAVSVRDTYHFSYADGTPYYPVGTTMYNWLNRDSELELRTLSALAKNPFNKVRFGTFPKWYVFNQVEPELYPYIRTGDGKIDFNRFDPRFFSHYETRLRDLQALGIEADIILFHPYDKWGFSTMEPGLDDAYVRYVVARFAAFRNVWWSVANEYDLFKKPKAWDHLGELIQQSDPFHHLRGIHNSSRATYDHSKEWVTHVSYQYHNSDLYDLTLKLRKFRKPVLLDEYGYEGNNGTGFGNLSGVEEIEAQWNVTMAGAYGTHGDCYVHPGDILWWAVGGDLDGDSPARYAFLKQLMTEAPYRDMEPLPDLIKGRGAQLLAKRGSYYLVHLARVPRPDNSAPVPGGSPLPIPSAGTPRLGGSSSMQNVEIDLDPGLYRVEMIDPWQMKIYDLGYTKGGVSQSFRPHLSPGLMRFVKVEAASSGKPAGTITELFSEYAVRR